jgi:O-antigen ligase
VSWFYPTIKTRFDNIQNDYNITEEGGRLYIWKQGIEILFNSPLFGVGANCSGIAIGIFRMNTRGMQAWQVTHSSPLQIAMETGFIGFIAYMMMNLICFKSNRMLKAGGNEEIANIAQYIEISFYGFWIASLFLTNGFSIHLHMLFGFVGSMNRIVNAEK